MRVRLEVRFASVRGSGDPGAARAAAAAGGRERSLITMQVVTDPSESTTVATWNVPLPNGTADLAARSGEVLTFVGGNGTGKSALATWMAGQVPQEKRRRVIAQRKIWFQSSGPNISASGRESLLSNMQYWDTATESRFVDHADGQRTDMTLFDLLGKIAAEDHQIAELSQTGRKSPEAIERIIGTRLFEVLNNVLRAAGLIIQVRLTDQQTLLAVHASLKTEYPIAQMSDGERNALLLAAEVLVASRESVIILDEPERHLHRSISAGLIEALIDARQDCAFVVFTHDLDLAVRLSHRPGQIFATIGVEWAAKTPQRWLLEEITNQTPITESARRGILGGRSKVLFVEGTEASLDQRLYGTLFPGWTLIASGSCEWVIRSVEGIRATSEHHWVTARGIVDGDGRSEQERAALIQKGVFPLRVSEVESLYYLPAVLEAVARKACEIDGSDPLERVRTAKADGISALTAQGGIARMAKKIATDEVTRLLVTAVPAEITSSRVRVSVDSPYEKLVKQLSTLVQEKDYEGLVRIASVRDSGFRDRVARALGINTERYHKAALLAITSDDRLLALLRREVSNDLD